MARKVTAKNAAAAAKVLGQSAAVITDANIKGAPTEATKTAERAWRATKPKGGKPGQALTSQTAEYAAGEVVGTDGKEVERLVAAQAKRVPADRIVEVKASAGDGSHIVVVAGKTVTVTRSKFIGELTKLAVVGGSMRAVEAYIKAHKPEAKLAAGLDGRSAPQSAMAAAESRKGKTDPVAAAPTGKTAKVAEQKAAKTERKATSKVGDEQKLLTVAANPKKAGTSTHMRYTAAYKVGRTIAEVLKHTTRADIDWDLKRGFITVG